MEDENSEQVPGISLLEVVKKVFLSDLDKAGIALGREPSQLQAILDGSAAIDEDLDMKIQLLAHERLNN